MSTDILTLIGEAREHGLSFFSVDMGHQATRVTAWVRKPASKSVTAIGDDPEQVMRKVLNEIIAGPVIKVTYAAPVDHLEDVFGDLL